MKYITSLHAYDALDQVVYAVMVREYSDYEHGESELVCDIRGSMPGKGVPDVHLWLRDVLEEVLKSL